MTLDNKKSTAAHTEPTEMRLLVTPGVLAGEVACGILAAASGLPVLAGVLLLLFICGMLSRWWAVLSVKNLDFALSADITRLFPGEETKLRYHFANRKLLPLLWLEAVHTMPENPPLVPKDDSLAADDSGVIRAQELTRRFSFILANQTLDWDEPWLARRRGVYPLDTFVRTGDALGLLPQRLPSSASSRVFVAVYPELVPVDVRVLLQNQWNAQSGSKGYMEDPTVIRSIRPYQPTDPARHINWRLAARQQPLSVNRFETILPKSVHFVIDSESYNGFFKAEEAFEQMLSVIASVVMQLNSRGVPCGISMSRRPDMPAQNLLASSGAQAADMLYALAGADFCPLLPMSDRPHADPRDDRVAPSVFRERELLSSAHSVGRFFYVAHSLSEITGKRLLTRLDADSTTLLLSSLPQEHASGALGAFSVLGLTSLCKGGAAHE